MKKNLKKIISSALILSLAFLLYPIHPTPVVHAAGLTNVKDTLSTLKASALADHEIIFTTNDGVANGEDIVVTMPANYDGETGGALTIIDVDMWIDTADGDCADAGEQTLVASGATDGQWDAVFSGTENRILTISSGGASSVVAGGEEVCIRIGENASSGAEQYANHDAQAQTTITLAVGGTDTGSIPVYIVTDDTVVTTATVLASLSFDVVGDETMGFGTIATDASRWANTAETGADSATIAHTLTASTNSTSGYTITVKGDTLKSTATPGHTITAMAAEAALNAVDTEQFGLRITDAGGTGITVDADYDNTPADHYYYGATASTADSIAVCAAASAQTTYSIYYAANIADTTEAHTDYTASLIYVATGNF